MHSTSKIEDEVPMEIDESTKNESKLMNESSESSIKTSVLDNCKLTYRGQIPVFTKEPETPPEQNRTGRKFNIKIVVSISIIIFSILAAMVPYYDKKTYKRTIEVDLIKKNLVDNVLNQKEPLQIISYSLDILNEREINVLIFLGTTGVGKTYCAHIIKQGFKIDQVYELDINMYNEDHIYLHRVVPYLIILDNLKPVDISKVKSLINTFPKDRAILVITIFNIQDLTEIGEHVVHRELLKEIPNKLSIGTPVIFNSLTKSIVQKYIETLQEMNLDADYKGIEAVIEDHDFDHYGLKGFFAEVDLLNHPRFNFSVIDNGD